MKVWVGFHLLFLVGDKMEIPQIYGTIINQVKYKHKLFIITDCEGIYSLIEHHLAFDITNVILRCSDIEFIEFKLKEELKK